MLVLGLCVLSVLGLMMNALLLSWSFRVLPSWEEASSDIISSLADKMPAARVLQVGPAIARFILSIDVKQAFSYLPVTCDGQEASSVLFVDAVIILLTVFRVDSQLHT